MGIGAMTAVSGQGGREEGREDWAGVYFSNSSSWRSLASRLSFDNGICVPSAATHQGVDVSIVVTNSAARAYACVSMFTAVRVPETEQWHGGVHCPKCGSQPGFASVGALGKDLKSTEDSAAPDGGGGGGCM